MTLSILSQSSVDQLRMLSKRNAVTILDTSYDELVTDYSLQELDIDVKFDDSVTLQLPKGESQESNNDDKNCMLMLKALPTLTDIDATDERLWVTLGLRDFKEYTLARWPKKNEQKASNHILHHWFAGTTRGLMLSLIHI